MGVFRSKKNDEWLDWLTDDPMPVTLRQRMRTKAVQEASRPVVRRPGQPARTTTLHPPAQNSPQSDRPHSVSINISFPKFKKPVLPKNLPQLSKRFTNKQLGILSSALIAVTAIGVIAVHFKNTSKEQGNTGVLSASSQNANFSTLNPDKSASASEKRYDPEKKVVSYTDSIGGVGITISQQQLPAGFQDNTEDKVKKLAQDFSANEVLSTANPTAYLGTSVKGPQTVIFAKNGLLVFIQSTKRIDNHDWAEYITNLK